MISRTDVEVSDKEVLIAQTIESSENCYFNELWRVLKVR
jgi:hypothetical protein